MSIQYIYLIIEREFIGRHVYKIGRTLQPLHKRISAYPKDSQLVIAQRSQNHQCEDTLKKEFSRLFKHRKDIGSEYFEGDVGDMIGVFKKVV
jgi:hypothetical protein